MTDENTSQPVDPFQHPKVKARLKFIVWMWVFVLISTSVNAYNLGRIGAQSDCTAKMIEWNKELEKITGPIPR